jgi:uncharacterized protein YaeQ
MRSATIIAEASKESASISRFCSRRPLENTLSDDDFLVFESLGFLVEVSMFEKIVFTAGDGTTKSCQVFIRNSIKRIQHWIETCQIDACPARRKDGATPHHVKARGIP